MASLNKLAIRGVRSFSPEDDEQVLEFLFPVTIITGANGCGKTTIIESMKYAVTGSLPPGKNAGQSFVHDPKSVGSSVVKASVRLRFTNRAGDSMVLIRSMELTQKKKSMTFKSLDGLLRSFDPTTGQKQSMSHKCSDLDKHIPMLLGVSKPVLEHVVFCHQEDSSWPLMDSAVLKKRFDDIFDSTRYAKALKSIAEIKKEYTSKVKEHKISVAEYKSHKHAAGGFQRELEKHLEDLESHQNKITKCRAFITKEEKTIGAKQAILDEGLDLQEEVMNKVTIKDNLEIVLKKQSEMLEEDLTKKHTHRELKDMQRDLDEKKESIKERKQDLEIVRDRLKEEIDLIRKEQIDIQGEIGKLQAEKEARQRLLKQRLVKMEDISQKHSIDLTLSQSQSSLTQNSMVTATQDGSVLSITDSEMKSFERNLEQKKAELVDKLKEEKARARAEEDRIQSSLNELEAKYRALEMNRQKSADEIKAAQQELRDLNKTQSQSGKRITQREVDEAKRQAISCAKSRDNKMDDPRKNEIPIEIKSLEEKSRKRQNEIEDLHATLQELRLNSEAQNELSLLQDQVKKDIEGLAEAFKEQSYELSGGGFTAPKLPAEGDDLGEQLLDVVTQLSNEVRAKFESTNLKFTNFTDDIAGKERTKSQQDGLLNRDKRTLGALQNKAKTLEGEDGEVSRYRRIVKCLRQFENSNDRTPDFSDDNPQEILAYIEDRLDKEKSSDPLSLEVVGPVLKKLGSMGFENKDEDEGELSCPCCTRAFNGRDELLTFRERILELCKETSELVNVTEKEKKAKQARKNYKTWRNTISSTSAGVAEHKRIISEISSLEENVSAAESKVSGLRNEIAALEEGQDELKGQVNEMRSLMNSADRWVDEANRICDKKRQIEQKRNDVNLTMSCLAGGETRDVRTVEMEYDSKRDEKERMTNQIGKLNKELSTINQFISQLTQKASNLHKLATEKETRFREEQKANVRKEELKEKIMAFSEAEKETQKEMQPLKPKMRVKESEKTKQREYAKEEEDRLSNDVSVFSAEMNDLDSITRQIANTASNIATSSLERLNEKISNLKAKVAGKVAELEKLEPELQKMVRRFEDQDRHRKLISENIEFLKDKAKLEKFKEEIEELRQQLGRVDGFDTAYQEQEEAKERLAGAKQELANLDGRKSGYTEQIIHLQKKLKSREYRNVEEQYRVATIMESTTKTAISDLEKYANALDRALLRYHGIKIEEINKIIRELWLLTYKGEDITSIKLVSSQDAKAAKSYNYRVVMTKGSTELDMRGRCSAGQRVLASLVIRLALAETFCVNCGCIALDEPTVNLDYRNKEGLAAALAKIIASRARQRNFQLVVITHDEEFVSMMKVQLAGETGFSMPEKYFHVRREENDVDGKYYSKIDTVDWDEIS